MNNYTTNPISMVAPVKLEPEYMRLPKPGTRDPVFGLSRTVLNELILPCEANKGRPSVRSVVLRKRGARTGLRLIDLNSLRVHLDKQVEPAYKEG